MRESAVELCSIVLSVLGHSFPVRLGDAEKQESGSRTTNVSSDVSILEFYSLFGFPVGWKRSLIFIHGK